MKKIIVLLAVAVIASTSLANSWETFVIRENSTDGAPLIIDNPAGYVAGSVEFVTFASSQKAGWGSSDLDGCTIGQIGRLGITRLDDYTRFANGSGPNVAPYFNIWVTDGSGNFAVVANEPSNANAQLSYNNGVWDIDATALGGMVAKAYENSDLTWITNLDVDNDGLTFSDLSGLTIQAPTVADFSDPSWTGHGGGAPNDLYSDFAYGFNWVFGDTLANYVSGDTGFVVANPIAVAVPVPGAFLLGGIGISLVGWMKRRKSL